jgi:hypothetical protein
MIKLYQTTTRGIISSLYKLFPIPDKVPSTVLTYLCKIKAIDVNEALKMCCQDNKENWLHLLITNGADPNVGMEISIHMGHLNIVKHLVESGAQVSDDTLNIARTYKEHMPEITEYLESARPSDK